MDVFSLGHLFFRVICLHEPWHTLEQEDIPKIIKEMGDAELAVIGEAMFARYTYDPEKRPSARSLPIFWTEDLQSCRNIRFSDVQGKTIGSPFGLDGSSL